MKFAVAKKIEMTRIFDESGKSIAGTVLEVSPMKIKRLISKERNGYNAVVLTNAEETKKDFECEFRVEDIKEYKADQAVASEQFELNDNVQVNSKSKGKGFSGVIKRHGFSRGPMSHGSNHHRAPGSIGGGYPQRVVLGRRMAGRMGGDFVTIKNLKVLAIDNQTNRIIVSGAIPGPKQSIVKILSNTVPLQVTESNE